MTDQTPLRITDVKREKQGLNLEHSKIHFSITAITAVIYRYIQYLNVFEVEVPELQSLHQDPTAPTSSSWTAQAIQAQF